MKKFIVLFLIFSVISNVSAQLEFYNNQDNSNLRYESLFQSFQNKTPQYRQNLRGADPDWFEQYMLDFQEETLYPGMSVCFLRDGNLYWKNHYGFANIESSEPVTDQTAYTVASISKTIMITAVMQLYEQGMFDLDDDISDHITFLVRNPNHPDDVITIRQLATHTSSIADNYNVLNAVLFVGGDNPISLDTFLQGYLLEGGTYYDSDNYYSYSPGQAFNYSNVGSCILAYMVECFTGMNFETYCQENVFGPLSMEETSYLFASLDPQNLATPYTIQGNNVIVTPQSSWPIYPIGNLKVSSKQLAKHLGMYMNYGAYSNTTIIDSTTVELITDLHYTNNVNVFMGLIWFIDPYPWFYSHTGRWYGFNTIYGYNKEENYGMIWLSNGDNYNALVSGQVYEFWYNLILYSAQYEPFSIESLTINDTDGDGILEPGENVDLYPGIRNITNINNTAENVTITLSTDCPYISFTGDSIVNYGNINYLEETQNMEDPISFQIGDDLIPGNVEFNILYSWDEDMQYQTTIDLYVGQAEILLVSDERDNRGKLIHTANWYRKSLDSLGYSYHYYDVSVLGDPGVELLNNFTAVIWFTGYDEDSTLTQENQQVLAEYLDNGGRLFLSGQNISQDIQGSDFLSNYLHAEHIEDSWSGISIIRGIDDDPVGNGLTLQIDQGDAAGNQYSMDVIESINGGEKCFGYFPQLPGAGIRYESGDYKTVFFGFGFEGINTMDMCVEVMKRVLEHLDVYVGVAEMPVQGSMFKVQCYPNPSCGISDIGYLISDTRYVALEVYNTHGQKIRTLVNENQPAGEYSIHFDGSDLPGGIYFLRLQAGDRVETAKMVLVK
ncbi:MAG: serine hydrolase [Bacteroidales bacterium]|nr:serine hydrolase [Bacteroidales bacterium]